MKLNINNAAARAALVSYIEQLKGFDPNSGSMIEDETMTRIHAEVVEHLRREVLCYDRALRTDCHYEPIAGYVHVMLRDGKVMSMEYADKASVQMCLVWPNTIDDVPPYEGTWDGDIQDFHMDEPYTWSSVRDYPVFGFESNGCKDYAPYRFVKTNLIVVLRDTDGSERLPDVGDILYAAKTKEEIDAWINTWDTEEYGEFSGGVFENVPVRLVFTKHHGDPPFTGSWDNAPWEEG